MTQGFKNNILAWLTGKYESENPGTNLPSFINTKQTTGDNFYDDLQNSLNSVEIYDVIQTTFKADNYNLLVAYGDYYDENSNVYRGFICIFDETGKTQQIITEYSSGTKMRRFVTLNITDDGMFYGVDSTSNFGNRRVILLNNFVLKKPSSENYEVTLRNSYLIPNSQQAYNPINNYTSRIKGIKKSPTEATYLIYGEKDTTISGSTLSMPFVTKFKINVGSTNEWQDYTYSNNAINVYVFDLYVSDWENLFFQIGAFDYVNSNGNCWYSEYSISASDTYTFSRSLKNRLYQGTMNGISFGMWGIDILNENDVYVSYSIKIESALKYELFLDKIDRSSGNKTNIYDLESDPTISTMSIEIRQVQGEIFIQIPYYPKNALGGAVKVGHIINDTLYTIDIAEMDGTTRPRVFYIVGTYNLYTCNSIIRQYNEELEESQNILYSTQQIYNPFNYNGIAYNGLNAMVPNSAILYDENNDILFARNLYNKTLSGNTTTSTLEVPNAFLNDITIAKQQLFSETNNILNEIASNIQKNIYETLNINFINTLLIENQNDPNNEIENIEGSIRLNNSISLTTDYDNAKAIKYKINYADETNIIKTFKDSEIVYNNNTAYYEFYIYTGQLITTIDIISNDEATIYQSIDTSNLELNKLYKLKQNVEII